MLQRVLVRIRLFFQYFFVCRDPMADFRVFFIICFQSIMFVS